MKLLALRLSNFRRFRDPVAIEGFDTGLNILAGPNEIGKSTLFEALEAAFLTRFQTTGANLDKMRPRGGGEPVVEADFETATGRWRIRKQFGRGKSAVLTDLVRGRQAAAAADAEERVRVLIGSAGEGPGAAGLVWVRQQRALLPPDPDVDPDTGKPKGRGEANALLELLNREVEAAAGAEATSRIHGRVREALAGLVTPGREGPKKGGPYDVALQARTAAAAGLASARAVAEASEARLEKIAQLTAALAKFESPSARADRSAKLSELEAACAEALKRKADLEHLKLQLETRRAEAQSARQAAGFLETQAKRALELREMLNAARALETDIRTMSGALNLDRATPARLKRLADLARDIKIAESDLARRAATVEIRPFVGAQRTIAADGRIISDPESLNVTSRLEIEIEGAGRISVVLADAASAGLMKERLAAASAERDAIYAEIGVFAFDDALKQGEARTQLASNLDMARARLSAIAPRGVAVLEKELAQAEQQTAPAPAGEAGSRQPGQRAAELELAVSSGERAVKELELSGAAVAPAKLAAEVQVMRAAAARDEAEVRRLQLEIEKYKGEQSVIDAEGRAGEVSKAEGEMQRCENEVSRFEKEIAAMRLLASALSKAEQNVRDRYLAPVAGAAMHYLAHVFPGADLGFGQGFSLEAITRAGEREEFAALSDGTREQLAVLVRMSFARLLAERGAPVPLVLDDPLVYSDDARLAAMCTALEAASLHHQIILFTCRETAFQKLSGRRLRIERWRPE